MLISPQLSTILYRIGLSPFAAALLLIYFVFFLTVQQFLPAGQNVLQSPFNPLALPTYAYLTVFYAGRIEFFHGGVKLNDRTFWRNYVALLVIALLFFSFFHSFGPAKSLIPFFNPYYLDPWLQKADIWLHLGTAPWGWFAPFLDAPSVETLNLLYLGSWMFVMMLYVIWQLSSSPSFARTQFLSCFIIFWIVAGIAAATAFASVGPMFYSSFYQDQFAAMNDVWIAQLYPQAPATAGLDPLDVRNGLLGLTRDKEVIGWNGISAMPSIHTAVAMLLALHSYCYARRLSYFLIPFALFIILGSVALGWHYALDTYGSAILLAIVWTLHKRYLRRWLHTTP